MNRGWVPESWRQQFIASSAETPKPVDVEVDGLIVESERPSVFVPKNDPQMGNWFSINASEIVCCIMTPTEYLNLDSYRHSTADCQLRRC